MAKKQEERARLEALLAEIPPALASISAANTPVQPPTLPPLGLGVEAHDAAKLPRPALAPAPPPAAAPAPSPVLVPVPVPVPADLPAPAPTPLPSPAVSSTCTLRPSESGSAPSLPASKSDADVPATVAVETADFTFSVRMPDMTTVKLTYPADSTTLATVRAALSRRLPSSTRLHLRRNYPPQEFTDAHDSQTLRALDFDRAQIIACHPRAEAVPLSWCEYVWSWLTYPQILIWAAPSSQLAGRTQPEQRVTSAGNTRDTSTLRKRTHVSTLRNAMDNDDEKDSAESSASDDTQPHSMFGADGQKKKKKKKKSAYNGNSTQHDH